MYVYSFDRTSILPSVPNPIQLSGNICLYNRTRSCMYVYVRSVSSKFSHGQIALLGTVRKDIVAAGESPEGDSATSRVSLRFTFPTDTSATHRRVFTRL